LISQCLAVTSGGLRASARGSASRARCHRLQAPNITMLAATRGGSGLRTGKTSSHAGLCGTQVADAARHKPLGCDGTGVHCTTKVYYFPSQPQRPGISYAESKTECQPTNDCKLYSSKILDRSRDRKAHGLCPQAQPLRTSRRDHDPGHLPTRTAGLRSVRSAVAPGRARPRPHARPQGQERHAIRPSYPGG
jgi:hypothetical protein